MSCITNRALQHLTGKTCLVLGLLLLATSSHAGRDGEPRYLDVTSQGYSRFEISDGDVVAFYADGVEFTYLNVSASADNLRYNHASQEAVVEGVVQGTVDDARFNCQNLYLNGEKGVFEITGSVHVEYLDTELDCETIKANFPGGATDLEIEDLIVVAGPAVEVRTREGTYINTPELTFTGHDMMVSVTDTTRMVLALEDAAIDDDSTLRLNGLELEFESMFCSVDSDLNPQQITLNHVSGVSDDITFTASALQGLTDQQSTVGIEGDWKIVMRNMDGDVTVGPNWLYCSALVTECEVRDMELGVIELSDSVRVRTDKGAFFAEQARAIPKVNGIELILPDKVSVEFNLARLSGQDPIEFTTLGEDGDG